MRILTVDIGTGTQDIYLYDSRLDMENGLKLVLPSPTMMVHRRIKQATRTGSPLLITGHLMGGGPSAWAVESHARLGLPVFATEDAARTLNDDLEKVGASGIKIVSEDEVSRLPAGIARVEFRDFDFEIISEAFAAFGVSLHDLDAAAVAVFDHGAAPPNVSDRQFRFDYLDQRIRALNSLSAFAYVSSDVPPTLTRLRSVVDSTRDLACPLVVMDTAPAAVLGATFDPVVAALPRKLIVNVGNFHTLAFRLGGNGGLPGMGIEGVFEHHTGEIDLSRLQGLLFALADGSLKHEDVFNDMGHGALVYSPQPLELQGQTLHVVVTGPRRSMFNRPSITAAPDPSSPRLHPYFAVPFGDMMISGCFGLLAAVADVLPHLGDGIRASMKSFGPFPAPWDID